MLTCSRCGIDISKHDECYEKGPVVCHDCTVKERDALKEEIDTFKLLVGFGGSGDGEKEWNEILSLKARNGKCVWTRDKKAVACVSFDIECFPGGYAVDWADPDCEIGFKYCPHCGKEIEEK